MSGGLLLAALVGGLALGYHLRPVPAPAGVNNAAGEVRAADLDARLARLEWYARATEGLVIRHGGFSQEQVDQTSREANR